MLCVRRYDPREMGYTWCGREIERNERVIAGPSCACDSVEILCPRCVGAICTALASRMAATQETTT